MAGPESGRSVPRFRETAVVAPWEDQRTRPTPKVRRVSVIVPMLNEAEHLPSFVEDLQRQDFSGDVEIIVADGQSSDSSREILTSLGSEAGLDVTILENPAQWVSSGLNECIRHARGDLLVRLDCHSRYPPDYLRLCAEVAEETGADAVGGIVVPRGRSRAERAVACAMDSPFGGIGWMRGTSTPVRRESDILTYGAFRPEAFSRAGLFDESLRRNQDDEFTLRIRLRGGRVVLDSSIMVFYTPRASYNRVFSQYADYGYWKVAVMAKHRRVLSARSMVPPLFVSSLAALVPAAFFSTFALRLAIVEATTYVAGAVGFGAMACRRRNEPWSLVPRVAATFPMFHLGYGAGVLRGLLRPRRCRGSTAAEPVDLAPIKEAR
jgi:succinoglycan biosynthesis protein ExoA